jgi:hypothetical protein
MTHRGDRSLRVGALARVEGEGAMRVRVERGVVTDVGLDIYEPPRFFEALLRGRRYTEPPDITARICEICPVAYQMSACQATAPSRARPAPAYGIPQAQPGLGRRGSQRGTLRRYSR